MVGYGQALVAAAAYDPVSRIAIFPLPRAAPVLRTGQRLLSASAADFQEAKNVDSVGDELLPNTAFASGNINVVNGPVITWVTPEPNECAAAPADLLVIASSTVALRSVRFLDGTKPITTVRRGTAGIYSAAEARRRCKGRHTLQAIVTDAKGRQAKAQRVVRVCVGAVKKTAVVTGASSGIGEATARARGAWLVLRARRPAAGATRAARVRARR